MEKSNEKIQVLSELESFATAELEAEIAAELLVPDPKEGQALQESCTSEIAPDGKGNNGK